MGLNVSKVASISSIGAPGIGHIQSSDQPENRRANDKFQSSAGIGRLPLEGPQSGSASNFRSWP